MNQKLKERIIEKFHNQANFSMKIVEDETCISRVVNGRRKLNPERQKLWAEILKCKPSDIFSDAA